MRKKMKLLACLMALSVAGTLFPQNPFGSGWSQKVMAAEKMTEDEVKSLGNAVSYKREAVHDPSIVKNGDEYYVFGTLMTVAKTTDLKNWSSVSISGEKTDSGYFGKRGADGKVTKTSYNDAFRSGGYGKKMIKTADGKSVEVDFSSFSAKDWICNTTSQPVNGVTRQWTVQGNMWAPDILYNKQMKKWCLYLSLNGDVWNSVIVLLTSDNIEGPYVYEAPIVYTGFTAKGQTSYKKMDLSLAVNDGKELGSLPVRYDNLITNVTEEGKVLGARHENLYGDYWTNGIDPCVFYDENGKLWMSYGSWFGGIWMLELDEATGLRDYSVKYEYQINGKKASEDRRDKNVTSDPYFGKKIAGGNVVSGEGSYIRKIGSYYYLCTTYGELNATGGYNMRVFRSKNPDGPYVDTKGSSAIYTSWMDNFRKDSYGLQLMGNYQWDTMEVAQVAQGHNSLLLDDDGNNYVIYHTRFADDTDRHQLRVHQLYQNEDGWLIAAPYEYAGETVNDSVIQKNEIAKDKIAGNYQLIVHKYSNPKAANPGTAKNNLDIAVPENITLNADGTITGDYNGIWTEKQGTAYANIQIGSSVYKGVFTEQTIEGTDIKTLCFSAVSSKGSCIWGSKEPEDKTAVAYSANLCSVNIPENTYIDIQLPTEAGNGVALAWVSSNPAVIDAKGHVTIPALDTEVTLTAKFSKGNYYYEKSYHTKVAGSGTRKTDITGALVASYNFNDSMTNSVDTSQSGSAKSMPSGKAPELLYNAERQNKVLHQYFGYADAATTSYVQFPNPLKGKELSGATVSLWVNNLESDPWDAIWGFWDQDASDRIDGRMYLTPNMYFGFNGTGGWFDCNHPDKGLLSDVGLKEWKLITVTVDTEGFDIYIDGKLAFNEEQNHSFNSGNGFRNYQSVLNLMQSSDDFYLGNGSWWGSAPLYLDNLKMYSRALSEADVAALYLAETEGSADNLIPTEYQEPEEEEITDNTEEEEYLEEDENWEEENEEENEEEEETITKKKVSLNKKKLTLKKGKSFQLKLKNAEKKISWKSSNKKIAKVSAKGRVTAKKKGKAVIKAVFGKKTYQCKITVK